MNFIICNKGCQTVSLFIFFCHCLNQTESCLGNIQWSLANLHQSQVLPKCWFHVILNKKFSRLELVGETLKWSINLVRTSPQKTKLVRSIWTALLVRKDVFYCDHWLMVIVDSSVVALQVLLLNTYSVSFFHKQSKAWFWFLTMWEI